MINFNTTSPPDEKLVAVSSIGEKTFNVTTEMISVACQTDPNLIDKLIDTNQARKQFDQQVDLYQEYVRSAQCEQFWPLDKNPIRSLVPAMLTVDLPEQHLKNESLMFDLVQAITNNSKLVNLLAKYIHHIVPNVIISKRIDLIPLITCTIRVCRDTSEQERLLSLLFNLIKRPNEEQRRMILSGIIVVMQVSPHQNSSLLLPNLWDHLNDKFPERRILLAEACATLAHYVRPAMRTNLILSILIQLLKDKSVAVRVAACKSFACLLTLIMDRNDEVFDACLTTTEDIIHDMLQQTPVAFCEHRFELEQMRFCILETIFPLVSMWAVKLNRFKLEMAEFYLAKAECPVNEALVNECRSMRRSTSTAHHSSSSSSSLSSSSGCAVVMSSPPQSPVSSNAPQQVPLVVAPQVPQTEPTTNTSSPSCNPASSAPLTTQRAVSAYLKMLHYLIPFVFSDAVHTCAWLSKSSSSSSSRRATDTSTNLTNNSSTTTTLNKFANKLLEPTLIVDESAVNAFRDQLEQEHMRDSLNWLLEHFLPKLLQVLAHFSQQKFHSLAGQSSDQIQEFLLPTITAIRQLCLLFGKHATRTKIRPLIKQFVLGNAKSSLFFTYVAALTSFEPIEQLEFEEIVLSIRQNLFAFSSTRNDIELLAVSIKILATNSEQIHSPSTRQKFLTYILDALVNYSNQIIRSTTSTTTPTNISLSHLRSSSMFISSDAILIPTTNTIDPNNNNNNSIIYNNNNNNLKSNNKQTSGGARKASLINALIGVGGQQQQQQHQQHHLSNGCTKSRQDQQTQAKEFMLILFRHILTCLIDPVVRPTEWAHILVTKFLPLLILLANDATDVYVCTYARLMCAQLVDTFDNYLNNPKMTQQLASSIMPALNSLKSLTEQIKASNLKRQIECLTRNLNEKFFTHANNHTESVDQQSINSSPTINAWVDQPDTHAIEQQIQQHLS